MTSRDAQVLTTLKRWHPSTPSSALQFYQICDAVADTYDLDPWDDAHVVEAIAQRIDGLL